MRFFILIFFLVSILGCSDNKDTPSTVTSNFIEAMYIDGNLNKIYPLLTKKLTNALDHHKLLTNENLSKLRKDIKINKYTVTKEIIKEGNTIIDGKKVDTIAKVYVTMEGLNGSKLKKIEKIYILRFNNKWLIDSF